MDRVILQSRLPDAPWHDPSFRRLPGMRALGADDWLMVDEAYAAQMALREALIETRRDEVLACPPGAGAAAEEALGAVLGLLRRRADFAVTGEAVRRPDGRTVGIDGRDPLGTLGRLVQEDICILERRGEEHVLTAAVLAFPSGWTLAEKLGRPLSRIHRPVPSYGEDIARRVQRLFDGLKAGRPMMRSNLLRHSDAALFAPRPEAAPRTPPEGEARYLRSERQCLVRLPRTEAVIFTIHTTIVETAALSPEDRATLERRPD